MAEITDFIKPRIEDDYMTKCLDSKKAWDPWFNASV